MPAQTFLPHNPSIITFPFCVSPAPCYYRRPAKHHNLIRYHCLCTENCNQKTYERQEDREKHWVLKQYRKLML